MSIKPRAFAALFSLAMLAAGCSSEPSERIGLTILTSLVDREPEPVSLPSDQVADVIPNVLAATDEPLLLATFRNSGNNVFLRRIASNGPYETWADAGTTERRTITTRDGMLTATRGLSRDLMSSDIQETAALVKSRTEGRATRVQRYLDGENQIVEISLRCYVKRGDSIRVRIGEIDRPAVQMVETCQDAMREWKPTNSYSVDASGRILKSVQWMNDVFGPVTIQRLR